MKIDNKPMMADQEIKIIEDILSLMHDARCLEWGSGSSTLYFSKLPTVKSWLTIEDNGHYVDWLRDKASNKVQTIWITGGESYADCVQRSNIKFDFILIDGLDREKCLENAFDIVSKDGVILLHDAGRKEYQDFIKKHGGTIICEGEEPYQGFYKHRGLAVFRK